ncbi:uncharacterized protein [Periplaneta americana]|uniref:uncharacterized protein n=1 Tax=Periplaneta americana TaxID=6978 RepID=UPI0037E73FBE
MKQTVAGRKRPVSTTALILRDVESTSLWNRFTFVATSSYAPRTQRNLRAFYLSPTSATSRLPPCSPPTSFEPSTLRRRILKRLADSSGLRVRETSYKPSKVLGEKSLLCYVVSPIDYGVHANVCGQTAGRQAAGPVSQHAGCRSGYTWQPPLAASASKTTAASIASRGRAPSGQSHHYHHHPCMEIWLDVQSVDAQIEPKNEKNSLRILGGGMPGLLKSDMWDGLLQRAQPF